MGLQYNQYILSLFGYHLQIKVSKGYDDRIAGPAFKWFFSDKAPDQCDGHLTCTIIDEPYDIPASVDVSKPEKGLYNYPILHYSFLRDKAARIDPGVQSLVELTRMVLIQPDSMRMEAYCSGWSAHEKKQSIDFFLFLFVACLLARNQGLVLHACGVVIDGLACAFTGPSGAGKSTAGDLIKKDFMLADDIIGITGIGSQIMAHSTPLSFSRITDGPCQAPLTAIFFPKKAGFFDIKPISPREAFFRYLAEHADYVGRLIKPYKAIYFELAHVLFHQVPSYQLDFPIDFIDTDEIKKVMARSVLSGT